ncbi:MAG: Smr protein/MutS2 [Halothiobacillaceae bacterium]|nr:MAG: Smr protein/MutS2 [Halothiobacillaceae bacterium]
MKRRTAITPEERDLFRREVGAVKPLVHSKVSLRSPPPQPLPRQRWRDEQQVIHDMMSDHLDIADVETGEELLFTREGISPLQMRKLRRGQFCITRQLDLHGLTADNARQALALFLQNCQLQQQRCVRIIHGKGHGSYHKIPILKNKVNRWLRQRDEVLAFCSALPNDGGTGALYVLLKRR